MAILDKFYTKQDVAKQCISFLRDVCPEINEDSKFLEPSAGNGSFSKQLSNCLALDIEPEDESIQKQDFYTFNSSYTKYITIGNPPFGKRSKTAIDFFNIAAKYSEVIAFIVPVSFMKWSVQKELNKEFKLVDYFYLKDNSFLDRDKDFSVRTVFQIWKRNSEIDKRLKKAPPIKHNDFDIWQYNATPAAEKTIDEDWEIATYRQGYHDYNELFTHLDYDIIKEKMLGTKKQQFFFIKPKNDKVKEKILKMDFNALAERNTSTPGFGKGDFVSYYTELYGAD